VDPDNVRALLPWLDWAFVHIGAEYASQAVE
jgi:hypothetical protein